MKTGKARAAPTAMLTRSRTRYPAGLRPCARNPLRVAAYTLNAPARHRAAAAAISSQSTPPARRRNRTGVNDPQRGARSAVGDVIATSRPALSDQPNRAKVIPTAINTAITRSTPSSSRAGRRSRSRAGGMPVNLVAGRRGGPGVGPDAASRGVVRWPSDAAPPVARGVRRPGRVDGASCDDWRASASPAGLEDNRRDQRQGSFESEGTGPVSYTHLRAHETDSYLVCRLLLEKKK